MSDVAGAPPPPADAPAAPQSAPPAAPQRTEVPINQNPISPSNPVGSQAPDTPQPRPETRREGIQRAIEAQRAKTPAPPREAKRGDNQPPEDMPDEEKLDLKKRPSDQPRERGRFAARTAPDVGAPGPQAGRTAARPGAQAAPQPYRPPPPGSPAHHYPIARLSDRAKADWDKVPDSVRMDGHRIAREVDQAFRQYKGAHDYMQKIAPFAKMAHEQGTDLHTVLSNHVAIENKLREDPLGGLEVIAHNLNLQTPDGRKITFADICYDYLSRSPEQHQLIQQRNSAQAQQLQMQHLRQQQQALANEHRRMQYAHHFQTTRGAVDRYADQRPRFDELGDLIHREIQLGFSLDEAYRRAELLRPATAAQTRNGPTAAQTRTPDRSISGAPGGSPNGAANGGKPVSRKDAISRAIAHHRGAL